MPAVRLAPQTRLLVEASAAADVVLRTGLASVTAGAAIPWMLRGDVRGERERLEYYADLASERDHARVFVPPSPDVVVEQVPADGRLIPKPPGGNVCALRFDSPYETVNPAMRAAYERLTRNRTSWSLHWTHADGPRPTLIVIHGFGASPYWLNSLFFELPWFFRQGYDVLFYTLPLHGQRRGALVPMNGLELFSGGIARLSEALFQAVHDFRVLVNHLRATGVTHVGVTGLSLGGYVSALLAAVEDRLDLVIPNAPVTDMGALMREWFPANVLIGLGLRINRADFAELATALAAHSPLNYAPVVPRDRLFIIGGLGDRLAPPAQSELLWEHWGRPKLHWYPGNHTVHIRRSAYLKQMRRFLHDAGFDPA